MAVISTQNITYRLVANGTQLDVFKDEDLNISNNVTGLFDLGVLPSDFTRQITVPGTKVNNAFFEHVYDISIDNPFLFATNIKVPCYVDFNSVYLINGYLQLNKVNMYQDKGVESYEVTIFGTLSSFARTVNNTFLTQLTTLQKYNHTSSYDNIEASFSGSLFNGDIVYPLADYGQAWQFTPNEIWAGIDDNANPQQGLAVMDFKPAIRAKAVWDAIFEYTGYTYSSSFLNQPWFQDVYMVANNALKYPEYPDVDLETLGQIKISPFSGSGQTDLVIPSSTITNLPWYNVESDPSNVVGTNSSYTVTLDHSSSLQGTIQLNINLSGSLGAPALYLNIRETGSLHSVSNGTLVELNKYFENLTYSDFAAGNSGQNQTLLVSQTFGTGMLGPGTYYFGLEWTNQFSAPYNNFKFTLDPNANAKSYLEIRRVRQAADGRVLDIPSNMPYGTNGIKLIDFLVGIQKKFNLVIYPDKTKQNSFIVETFNDWYKKGRVVSFDNFIDLNKKWDVIPANNLAVNKLTFGDRLDGDYLSQQFSKGANREFGKTYYIDTTNFYSQGELNVETIFSSTPLSYLAGTGLSGSVAGANPTTPTQFFVGECRFGYTYAASDTCSSPARIMTYTTSGELTTGLIAYRDQYGTLPITGLNFIVADGGGTIYSLNSSTGMIGSATGYYC